jgi:uncharacterized protein (TIGR02246 family)
MLSSICGGSLLTLLFAATAHEIPAAEPIEQIVRDYVAAFNARDTESLLEMVTEDVQWLSVDGDQIKVETNDREELRRSITGYFKGCASCQSRLVHIFSTGSRVSALEAASMETSDGGVHEQQSLSVYEFSGARIKRVYYFPVER